MRCAADQYLHIDEKPAEVSELQARLEAEAGGTVVFRLDSLSYTESLERLSTEEARKITRNERLLSPENLGEALLFFSYEKSSELLRGSPNAPQTRR